MPRETESVATLGGPLDGFWFAPVGVERRVAAAEFAALSRIAPPRTYAKGSAIFRPGDEITGFHVVLSGSVKISSPDPDGERVLGVTGPDDLFGVSACSGSSTYPLEAVALEDGTKVVTISCDAFKAVSGEVPALAVVVSEALSERVRELENRLAWATLPAQARLARSFHSLATRFGAASGGGVVDLELPLSQEELASLAGTTRVSATRALGVWRDLGLVEGTRGRYRVDLERLGAFAEYLTRD